MAVSAGRYRGDGQRRGEPPDDGHHHDRDTPAEASSHPHPPTSHESVFPSLSLSPVSSTFHCPFSCRSPNRTPTDPPAATTPPPADSRVPNTDQLRAGKEWGRPWQSR